MFFIVLSIDFFGEDFCGIIICFMTPQEKLDWAKLLKDILMTHGDDKKSLFNADELATVKKILMSLIGGVKV